MLSLVSFIESPVLFASPYTPCAKLSTDDPSVSITQVGRSRFQAKGIAMGVGPTSVQLQINEERVELELKPQESPREWLARMQHRVPFGYCLISNQRTKEACDLVILETQIRGQTLPVASLEISANGQICTNLRSNVLEIEGTAVSEKAQIYTAALLTLDSHKIPIPLALRSTPSQTAQAVTRRLPAGYTAEIESPLGLGRPVRITFRKTTEVDRAAA